MNTLTHYADRQVTLNRGCRYKQQEPDSFVHKPKGLWVSVDGEDDWHNWCTREGFFLDGLKHAHRVTLADDANILWVSGTEQFTEFHKTYATEEDVDGVGSFTFYRELRNEAIDWPAVTSTWDGIFIAPYLWGFRLSHMWYYGWDCASGCIWNLDAIADFSPIPESANRFRELDMEEATE